MGMGVREFLQRRREGASGGSDWLPDWKERKRIDVWLHRTAPIVPRFTHQFLAEDEVEDEGRKKKILRYPRFISPDPDIVHRNQYFRDRETKTYLNVPPDLDPFLLLREWLRLVADHIGLDEPVFEWHDAKKRQKVVWPRGILSGLEKRGRNDFGVSLDTKIEDLLVVVDNDRPGDGPRILSATKMLGDLISEEIGNQMESLGEEEGDPQVSPYALRFAFDKTESPMNMYKVFRLDPRKCRLTEEIEAAISAEEYPDVVQYTKPGKDDLVKVRALMEAAAVVELPLDRIFSEDPEERASVMRPDGAAGKKRARYSGGGKPAAAKEKEPEDDDADEEQKPAPRGRRRVVKKDPPPPPKKKKEPEVEMIDCDECGKPMPAAAQKCPSCGTEYELDTDVADSGGAGEAAAEGPAADGAADGKCFSCSGAVEEGRCVKCGLEQGDDFPF